MRIDTLEARVRVGFLFNHYAEHQVPHSAPYAFELSRRHPEIDVILAYSSTREMRMLHRLAALYPDHRCSFRRLYLRLSDRLVSPFKDPWEFQRKFKILLNNLSFFKSLDVLVTPERTSLCLRTELGLKDLKLVHTRHGAGDAEGGFDDRSHRFDFTLLPGQKYADRLKALGFLEDGKYAITGWPKFEVAERLQRSAGRLFDNDKPIVIYNPHFRRRLSSWGPSGKKILKVFARTTDYNLIFAPHTLLFKRKPSWKPDRIKNERDFLARFRDQPNILIDTDSAALADMTYTLAADIYLGDVSSQVYEFLLRPRPCLAVNAHRVAWQNDQNYAQWRFGAVVDKVKAGLMTALDEAKERHGEFIDEQMRAFHYTFRVDASGTAAERGADAIAAFLQGAGQTISYAAPVRPPTDLAIPDGLSVR